MIGKTIKHYRILEELGRGGMGIVYKAEDLRLKRLTALKFLPPEMTGDPEALERFINEAQAASALDHLNICTIYEVGESDDGDSFISMAYYPGKTLKKIITTEKETSFAVDEVISIAIQLSEGFSKAHKKGIVHRDIKPGNIIITEDGTVKIIDFGLSKLLGGRDLTQSGTTKGTVAYMSPEQALSRKVDQRTDIWSLGVVMYEMLTGEKPFRGDYDQTVLYNIVNESALLLSQFRRDLPAGMQQIIDRMLAKIPDERYQEMAEVIDDLKSFVADNHFVLSKPRRRKTQFFREKIRRPLASTFLALAFFLTAYFAWQNLGSGREEPAFDSNLIAVLPFNMQGGEDLQYLAEGMPDLLSVYFDGAGELRRIDPFVIQRYLATEKIEINDVLAGEKVTGHFQASYFIVGNIYQLGEQTQITASVYDRQKGILKSARAEITSQEKIGYALDDLARQLLSAFIDLKGERFLQIAARTTDSPTALQAYLKGENLVRAGKYRKAMAAFHRAILADSTFALAYYKMAIHEEHSFSSIVPLRVLIEKALQYSERLPLRDQQLLGAYQDYYFGNIEMAHNKYQALAARYPDDHEIWFQYGIFLSRYYALLGKEFTEPWHAVYRALELNPQQEILYGYLQTMINDDQMVSQLDSVSRVRLRLFPESDFVNYSRVMIAAISNDTIQLANIQKTRGLDQRGFYLFMSSLQIPAVTGNYQIAKNNALRLFDPIGGQDFTLWGHRAMAKLYLRRGQRESALTHIDAIAEKSAAKIFTGNTILLLAPLMEASKERLIKQQVIAEQRATDNWYSGVEIHYTKGLVDAFLGNRELANQQLDSLNLAVEAFVARFGNNNAEYKWYQRSMLSLQAAIFFYEKNYPEAWKQLRQIQPGNRDGFYEFNLVSTHVFERYMRAKCLKEMGKHDEAIRWLSSVGTGNVAEIFYKPQRHYLMGEIYEETDEPGKAIKEYREFVQLWQNCDTTLQPLVTDIQSRIERLTSGE